MDWDKKTMTLSVRLDPETIEGLKKLAKLDDRKVSPYVARLLKKHLDDNRALITSMREAHKVCDQHGDLATASLLEEWIDQAEKRVWFLFETSRGEAH